MVGSDKIGDQAFLCIPDHNKLDARMVTMIIRQKKTVADLTDARDHRRWALAPLNMKTDIEFGRLRQLVIRDEGHAAFADIDHRGGFFFAGDLHLDLSRGVDGVNDMKIHRNAQIFTSL
mgnify:CR=1 FL=1